MEHDPQTTSGGCVSRRAFLQGTGAVAGGAVLLIGIPGLGNRAIAAQTVGYPRLLIGKLSALETNKPVAFTYPDQAKNANSLLVKLGTPAGGRYRVGARCGGV